MKHDSEDIAAWSDALGGPTQVRVENEPGKLSTGRPTTGIFGLHVLSYGATAQPNEIRKATDPEELAQSDVPPARMIHEHRLDLSLRRPLVSVSVLRRPATRHRFLGVSLRLTRISSSAWALPFLHAGATAVVGPRWPVWPTRIRFSLTRCIAGFEMVKRWAGRLVCT